MHAERENTTNTCLAVKTYLLLSLFSKSGVSLCSGAVKSVSK